MTSDQAIWRPIQLSLELQCVSCALSFHVCGFLWHVCWRALIVHWRCLIPFEHFDSTQTGSPHPKKAATDKRTGGGHSSGSMLHANQIGQTTSTTTLQNKAVLELTFKARYIEQTTELSMRSFCDLVWSAVDNTAVELPISRPRYKLQATQFGCISAVVAPPAMAPKSSRKGKGFQKLPFNDDAIQRCPYSAVQCIVCWGRLWALSKPPKVQLWEMPSGNTWTKTAFLAKVRTVMPLLHFFKYLFC